MKLHEMTGDQFARALCELAGPVERIAADPQIARAVERFAGETASPALLSLTCLTAQLLPLLMDRHAADTFCVLSVLTEKSVAELRTMNALALVQLVRSVWDGELAAFFTCAGTAAKEKSCVQ